MPDSTDHSQELEAEVQAAAMRERAQSAPAGESALECVECGEDIPPERRAALPGCQLCVECAERLEIAERVRGTAPR